MTRTTPRIRRALTAIALSAVAALAVVPLGQASDSQVDDWFRPAQIAHPQPTARLGNLAGDYMFQQYFRSQAKADDHILDVSARDAVPVPASNSNDHVLDVSARDAVLVPASNSNDHILDVSARDTVQTPSSTPDLRGDYMFQQYFRDAAKANDHVLDVSARDAGGTASVAPESTGGTDWGEIGVGIALALGGALLLVVLVAVGLEVRHSRHPLRSV